MAKTRADRVEAIASEQLAAIVRREPGVASSVSTPDGVINNCSAVARALVLANMLVDEIDKRHART